MAMILNTTPNSLKMNLIVDTNQGSCMDTDTIMTMYDIPSSKRCQTVIWKIGKENVTEPGLKPETSGLPYQCSSIWAIQPLDGGPPE